MKRRLIALCFFLLGLSIFAAELVEVTGLSKGPREGTVYLDHKQNQPGPVLLDCSSFLHGITINEKFLLLFEDECYDVYQTVKTWSEAGSSSCLTIDFEEKIWDLRKPQGTCSFDF